LVPRSLSHRRNSLPSYAMSPMRSLDAFALQMSRSATG
jgi:hypothetical protein